MAKNYLELLALRIDQPLGAFYLTSIKARDLRKFAFSEQLTYIDESGKLQGNQRKIDARRLSEIGKYIDSVEMAFPNAIILAVNYTENGEIIEDEKIRWDIEHIRDNLYKIVVPTEDKLAAIIDGQHRLNGFDKSYISNEARLDTDLPCSIYFDLPNSYQAFLFATINGNQKKVDKSLALEQFGFNVEEEPQGSWTPEKLAVYFTRKLNFKESPISGHIKIAPIISMELRSKIFSVEAEWTVSTATIVDGILQLISSKPKRDRVEMGQESIWGNRTRSMVAKFKNDKSPLRELYLNKSDDVIFSVINNFLAAVKKTVWATYNAKSYIFKTVGVQALFDLLRRIQEVKVTSDENELLGYLEKATEYDFSNDIIQASGIGRKDIRNALLLSSGLKQQSEFEKADLDKISLLKS